MAETIKVRYLSDKVNKLEYIGGKSDWIDLRAAEDVELKAGDFKLVPLGIAVQLPKGYEAHMIPRSSTYKNYGVIQANHMGMVDESYCGDNDQWYFPAIALKDTVIHAGERICQFRIMEHQPTLNFVAVETLGNADRGGIGSTGGKMIIKDCKYKTGRACTRPGGQRPMRTVTTAFTAAPMRMSATS